MEAQLRKAHSEREERLYLAMQACSCGGDYSYQEEVRFLQKDGTPVSCFLAECAVCHSCREFQFDISSFGDVDSGKGKEGVLNSSSEPSELLDVTMWGIYVLYYMERWEEADKMEERAHQKRALQSICEGVREALKFYPENEEYPPPSALFTPSSHQRFVAMKPWFRRSNFLKILSHAERALQSL